MVPCDRRSPREAKGSICFVWNRAELPFFSGAFAPWSPWYFGGSQFAWSMRGVTEEKTGEDKTGTGFKLYFPRVYEVEGVSSE